MQKIDYPNIELKNLWNEYADKINIGLKKESNKLLGNLIGYIDNLDSIDKENFVYFLCSIKFEEEQDINFQYPLAVKVIFPVLLSSIEHKKMPQLRWLYQMELYDKSVIERIEEKVGSGSRLLILQMALEIDPNDLKTVKLLLDFHFYSLWFGSHHLPDGVLISREDVEQVKNKIEDIFSKYGDAGIITGELINEYNYYVELYNDWFSFNQDKHEISFREWCIVNNKKYAWVKAYYYEK